MYDKITNESSNTVVVGENGKQRSWSNSPVDITSDAAKFALRHFEVVNYPLTDIAQVMLRAKQQQAAINELVQSTDGVLSLAVQRQRSILMADMARVVLPMEDRRHSNFVDKKHACSGSLWLA